MKRLLFLATIIALFVVSCDKTPIEQENEITYTELIIASKYGYVIDPSSSLPRRAMIIRESGENGKWEPTLVLKQNVLKHEEGYEYTVKAHQEPYEPGVLTEATGGLFWKFDEVLDKVQKDTELPDDVYLYTIGSPWGFDPRDPMLEFMLEHHKEIFGEDSEIDYPKK